MNKLPFVHKEVVVPDDVNVYFVGDIHGEYDLLMDTLKVGGFQKDRDYLFSVGDLIDRGPKNLEVLALFLYDNTGRYNAVLGNHDDFMIRASWDGSQAANWMYNGGGWAMDLTPDTVEAIGQDMLAKLPVFMTVKHRGKTYGVVHGGIPVLHAELGNVFEVPAWTDGIDKLNYLVEKGNLNKVWNLVNEYTWDRHALGYGKEFLNGVHGAIEVPAVDGVDYVFHGHSYVKEPLALNNRIYIDTGGTFNGAMTLVTPTDTGLLTFTSEPHNPEGVWGTI